MLFLHLELVLLIRAQKRANAYVYVGLNGNTGGMGDGNIITEKMTSKGNVTN